MSGSRHLVVFDLDEQRFALPLSAVDRIVQAVEITPLPEAPSIVLGVVNVGGRVLPVINMRRRCRLMEREIELSDLLVIAHTRYRSVALLVDWADVVAFPEECLVPAGQIMPGMTGVPEVVKREEGLILIYDPEALLSLEEQRALNGVADGAGAAGGA